MLNTSIATSTCEQAWQARPSAFARIGATLALFILTAPPACKRPQQPQMPPPQPPAVVYVHPLEKEITEWDEYTGRLAAKNSVEVRSRVTGYLQTIGFEDGEFVEEGDLLFSIDPRPFEAELERAEANLRQAEAQLNLAERNFSRAQHLRSEGVIAQEEFDTASNNRREAEANRLASASAVTAARLNLGFARVEATVSGRISRNYVSVGNLVTGGSEGSTLLTRIISYDPIYCYFDVDEHSFLKYQRMTGERQSAAEILEDGDQVKVQMALADEEGFPHQGLLNFIDNRIDEESNTIELRAVFSNPEHTFTPGLFARVRIPATYPYKAILIPDQAVQTDQARTFVYVVGADGKAATKNVRLGPVVDNLRVIREGVSPKDKVIAVGMQSVRPGSPVRAEKKEITDVVPAVESIPEKAAPKAKKKPDARKKRKLTPEEEWLKEEGK